MKPYHIQLNVKKMNDGDEALVIMMMMIISLKEPLRDQLVKCKVKLCVCVI